MKLTLHASNSLVQSSSEEDNSLSHFKKIPRILWNLEVHYRVHKIPSLVRILSQKNPILFKTHSNIIPHPIPQSFSLEFTHRILVWTSSDSYAPRALPMAVFLYHPNNIWCEAQIARPFIMQFFLVSSFKNFDNQGNWVVQKYYPHITQTAATPKIPGVSSSGT
jgi:hypothetical protein